MKVEEEEGKLKKEKKIQVNFGFSEVHFNKYSFGIRRWVIINPTVSFFEL